MLDTYASYNAPALDIEATIASIPTLRATSPATHLSPRYHHINTADILRRLSSEGFELFNVSTSKTRDENRVPYVKHLLRLRRRDEKLVPRVGGIVPEVCLGNSHDGRGSYQAFAGALKFACANGLLVGKIFGGYRVPHYGRDIADKVIDATFSVVESFEKIEAHVDAMQSRILSTDEMNAFAERALALRYGDNVPFSPVAVLSAKRSEDVGSDMWRVFNRVQENMVRGGARGVNVRDNGTQRLTTMRAIRGVDSSVKFNRGLWDLAAEFVPVAA